MKADMRISTIDIAKGIGIVLVIIGHALPSDSLLRIFLYTFHIPLFFILSGMLMKTPGYNKNILEDFFEERKLVGAYIFYSILFVIFDIVVRFFLCKEIGLNGVFWDIYQTVVFYGINVLWFLATLLLAKVLVKLICRILTKRIYWLIIGAGLFVAGSVVSVHIEWLNIGKCRLIYYPLLALLRATSVTIYILLGYIVREKVKRYIVSPNIGMTICASVIAALLLLLIFNLAGNVDIHVMRMGNYYVAFVCAILGSIMVFGVSILLGYVKGICGFFRYFGINSLFIMATHEYLKIRVFIDWILQKLNLLTCRYIVLLQIFLLCAVEYIICKLCATYVERIINKMVGKRF